MINIESIKALEIKTSVLFNCVIFFLPTLFYHVSHVFAVIPEMFSPTAELVIPIGIPTKEANAKKWETSSNRKSQNNKCSV